MSEAHQFPAISPNATPREGRPATSANTNAIFGQSERSSRNSKSPPKTPDLNRKGSAGSRDHGVRGQGSRKESPSSRLPAARTHGVGAASVEEAKQGKSLHVHSDLDSRRNSIGAHYGM